LLQVTAIFVAGSIPGSPPEEQQVRSESISRSIEIKIYVPPHGMAHGWHMRETREIKVL
jgi:hypothetical protein